MIFFEILYKIAVGLTGILMISVTFGGLSMWKERVEILLQSEDRSERTHGLLESVFLLSSSLGVSILVGYLIDGFLRFNGIELIQVR